jgi:hypothetical protein
MSNFPKPATCSLRFRRLWKPVVATGTGGTALVIWFEEILVFATEFIGLIFLPILAAIIYLFNIFLFKSFEPQGDDLIKVKE